MYGNCKQGWYTVFNTDKIIVPLDETMGSYKNGHFLYKSSLELNVLRFCDANPSIIKFSLEPFAIKYIKPTDHKLHRYYIDFFIQFSTGDRFLVEVKPYSQISSPKKPKTKTEKSQRNYQIALRTYAINTAKWNAAKEFCRKNDMKFIFLTEKELKH